MNRRVTVITGASRGIGRAIADLLASKGHDVVNLSRSAPAKPFPGESIAVDLADASACAACLSELKQKYEVERFVSNAAVIEVSEIEKISVEQFERLSALNLRAALQCVMAFAPAMKQRRYGRIVVIGSRAVLGKPGRIVYGMTKSGLIGMTRGLALELAPYEVTVNMVSPGSIETELFFENNDPNGPVVTALKAANPMKRMGKPEEIANAVEFFLRRETTYVTGQNLYVCGGSTVAAAGI